MPYVLLQYRINIELHGNVWFSKFLYWQVLVFLVLIIYQPLFRIWYRYSLLILTTYTLEDLGMAIRYKVIARQK